MVSCRVYTRQAGVQGKVGRSQRALPFASRHQRMPYKRGAVIFNRGINYAAYEKPPYQLEGVARVVLDVGADDLADHRVLAHEHGGAAAEGETDLGHLVRPDVVSLPIACTQTVS